MANNAAFGSTQAELNFVRLVAVYLGFADDLLEMETLPIVITPDGKTLVDDSGEPVHCAMNWRDKDAFLDLVTQRLIGGAL